MKVLTIGDIHGRSRWEEVRYMIQDYDKIVFIGDYVDSFDIEPIMILHNLKRIIEFKKDYPDKVELLLGNHDIQYIVPNQFCSGYQAAMENDYKKLFLDNIELFKIAFQYKMFLWTHAGVHKGWFKDQLEPLMEEGELISDALNELWMRGVYKSHQKWDPLFHVGHLRGGHAKVGGPLWLDKRNGVSKPLDDYHQIVGHTRVKSMNTIFPYGNNPDTSITFTDVLKDHEDDDDIHTKYETKKEGPMYYLLDTYNWGVE